MKVVISGGLGYIGGRLSKYFAELGHEVIALSRQAGGLDGIDFPAGMTVMHPDLVMADASLMNGADAFIHLAAMNEHDCIKYPEKAIEVNITGTLRWLDAAHRAGVTRFIYFSTAHVYGKPLEGCYDENSITHPVHPYAITHKCAEDYVLAYAAEKGMTNTVVRLTNAFGGAAFPTADRWTLLINDLCRSAVKTGRMELFTDGLQQRDFVCLWDVCVVISHLLNLPEKRVAMKIFNLGVGNSLTVWDMANKVRHLAEEKLKKEVTLTRREPATMSRIQPLEIKIEKLLATNIEIVNPVEDEISSTLEYFRKECQR